MQHYANIMLDKRRRLGPYPMENLPRVDAPTSLITGDIARSDERQHGFGRAFRGEFGKIAPKGRERFLAGARISGAFSAMLGPMAALVDGEVAAERAPLPAGAEVLSRHIKRLGYFMRADLVGICRLPQYAVYSHDHSGNPVELDHQFAIVLAVDQEYETMAGSTGSDAISSAQSMRSYSATAFISCMLADYIRRLGYPARAHHAGNYQVVVPPLLLHAGIGEMSRIGIVLNPFLGTRFKAAVVTTDLPLVSDRPVDFGLKEFCRKCLKCAVDCPSRALSSGEEVMHNGYQVWRLDVERCTRFRLSNPDGVMCGRCIKVCPWNKPPGIGHDLVRWLARRAPVLDRLLVRMDDAFGYGRQDKSRRWWFDLEDTTDG